MNLADAIRRAADGPRATTAQTIEATVSQSVENASVRQSEPPELPSTSVLGGNVVRIELFMTHEQTSSLLRAIMTGQHNVLTVPEAAHYLRVRAQALAKMAEDGEIPAVVVDGKFRFLKSYLDEWLATTVSSAEPTEDTNAA